MIPFRCKQFAYLYRNFAIENVPRRRIMKCDVIDRSHIEAFGRQNDKVAFEIVLVPENEYDQGQLQKILSCHSAQHSLSPQFYFAKDPEQTRIYFAKIHLAEKH